MKIGIITILKVNNYGAELQAYALQNILCKLGHNAEIIDYLFYKNPKHIRTKRSRPTFRLGVKKRMSEILYPIYLRLKTLGNSTIYNKREQRFEAFHRKHTHMSQTYRSIDQLFSAEMDYDIYIVGSDQVWNPGIYSSLDPYFLKFAPDGKKRLAYASSFGVSDIPAIARPYYSEALQHFNAIGVRESNAVELVKELSGKNAQWVLDPTLLLTKEDWNTIATRPDIIGLNQQRGFILLYELTPCPYITKLAKHLKLDLKLPIVRICKSASNEDSEKSILNVTDAGPEEFIWLFAHATFIITNSFHGSAFSINMERNFYTIIPLRKQNNSRQQSLLKLFGLENRLLVEGSAFPPVKDIPIDYSTVTTILHAERQKSIKFLNDNCK